MSVRMRSLVVTGSLLLSLSTASVVSAVGSPSWSAPGVTASAAFVEVADSTVIDTTDRAAVQRAFRTRYRPSAGVKTGWTGGVGACRPGTTSAAFKHATLVQIDYFRGLAGLEGVKLDVGLSARSQAAALMMDAANALSHAPGQGWPCFTKAGRQGASHSNLCLGCATAGAIAGYIADPGAGNEYVGHRQWMLFPSQTTMGIGATTQANAVYVTDSDSWVRPDGPPDWVAWPPAGFVPGQHIFPRFSLSRADADFSDATAKVVFDGRAVSAKVVVRNGYYGDPVVVIQVDLTRFSRSNRAKNHVFKVSVRHIHVDGHAIDHAWQTTVFDPS